MTRPGGGIVTDWRLPVPADVMEGIFWRATGPLITGRERQAVLAGMMGVLAADGILVNLVDRPCLPRHAGRNHAYTSQKWT